MNREKYSERKMRNSDQILNLKNWYLNLEFVRCLGFILLNRGGVHGKKR